MKCAWKLNEGIRDPKEKVFVNNDLTILERDQEKKLLDELRTLRENNVDDDQYPVIRNGKIVYQQKADSRQRYHSTPNRTGWKGSNPY